MHSLDRDQQPQRPSQEAGYSLLEVLLSSALLLMLMGGVSTMIGSLRDNYEDVQLRVDAAQGARIGMEQIQRDLQIAGVGLSRMQPPFPVLMPRLDGGIDLRVNRGQVTTFLVTAMVDGSSPLEVNAVTGFSIGDQIAVYDAAGSIELSTITAIDEVAKSLDHEGLAKAYDPIDGAAVALVQTITYRLVSAGGGTFDLLRETDGIVSATLAANVLAFDLAYYDSASPPALFTPVSTAEQLSIRTVEVTLTVVTDKVRLVGGDAPTFTLSARVSPRSLILF